VGPQNQQQQQQGQQASADEHPPQLHPATRLASLACNLVLLADWQLLPQVRCCLRTALSKKSWLSSATFLLGKDIRTRMHVDKEASLTKLLWCL
jgi:hypothetical protein